MQKSNRKKGTPIVFYAAMLLLCLTLFSTHMSTGLLARYITTASTEDTARVATFDVSAEGTLTTAFGTSMAPGDAEQKSISISNSSEVAVKYTVTVHSTGNLPLSLAWDEGAAVDNDAVITGTLAPGSSYTSHTLHIAWENVSGKNSYIYSTEIDLITVTVICEQID